MKTRPAIAIIEFSDIPVGISATDFMVKKAPIAALRSGTITNGRYLTLIGGSTASVEESYREGLFWGGPAVLDHVLLADVHRQLHAAILGERLSTGSGSLAIIQTTTATAIVRASEAALKGTTVDLVEIRLADTTLGGKGLCILRGELHHIEAAVALATGATGEDGRGNSWRIVSRPHEALALQIASGTHFAVSPLFDLGGEEG